MKILLLLLLSFISVSASNNCTEAFANVPSEAKQYTRILGHKNEYNSSCNIVYAYNIFLYNPPMMDELENDNVFAENLGEFIKNYPYTAQFIVNKKIFEFFNQPYSYEKKSINKAVKYAFTEKELGNKNNLIFLQFALEIVDNKSNTKDLQSYIKHLKNKYTIGDLEIIYHFWYIFKNKYKNKCSNCYKSFEKTINTYTLPFLKKFSKYKDDFFPVLLPEEYNNFVYVDTIKALMSAMKYSTLEQQAYFLKNISIDIQIALANGNDKQEIVNFFRPFIKKEFIIQFGNLNCTEKQGLAMLLSDNLDYKLDWIKYAKGRVFKKVIKALEEENNIKKMINILGLYNYASVIYSEMQTNEQREMLDGIISLPGDNTVFNLSLIYALGENTIYFNAIVNNNYYMYKDEKYKDIFYVRREGESILSLFGQGNKKFIEQVNALVKTPYEDIHDVTMSEKINYTIQVVDYASWATVLIPGVGIAAQIGKELAKTSLKVVANQVLKQGAKTSMKTGLKKVKQGLIQYWEDAVKYTGRKGTDKMINKTVLRVDQVLTPVVVGGFIYHYFFNSEQKKLCKEK